MIQRVDPDRTGSRSHVFEAMTDHRTVDDDGIRFIRTAKRLSSSSEDMETDLVLPQIAPTRESPLLALHAGRSSCIDRRGKDRPGPAIPMHRRRPARLRPNSRPAMSLDQSGPPEAVDPTPQRESWPGPDFS